ncbi:MAG TPA: FliM/FliN family flagellar motor switch protein [Kofleriaceae bacterium]|nr:FliM/FliN family flagellar motor switch protein [Kofleriaceae bacterium]
MPEPNFSAYPFDRLPRISRRDAAIESAIARWLGPARLGGAIEPYAAACDVRIAGETIEVWGPGGVVRALAERWLGGPAEFAAPRPLGAVEHALWALAVAGALAARGLPGEVWPRAIAAPPREGDRLALEVVLDGLPATVVAIVPPGLALRVPPRRRTPAWLAHATVPAALVVGRCALPREALAALAVRDVVTLEPARELALLGGAIGVRAAPNAVVAEVATGYVPRAMPVPDDARVELTVALGTTQLALRDVLDLAVGQVVPLGRPLAGPFEIRAIGRVIGRGELVDVDGELGVRIVSLEE